MYVGRSGKDDHGCYCELVEHSGQGGQLRQGGDGGHGGFIESFGKGVHPSLMCGGNPLFLDKTFIVTLYSYLFYPKQCIKQ